MSSTVTATSTSFGLPATRDYELLISNYEWGDEIVIDN